MRVKGPSDSSPLWSRNFRLSRSRKWIVNPDANTAGTADGLQYDYPPNLMQSFLATNVRLSGSYVETLVECLTSIH